MVSGFRVLRGAHDGDAHELYMEIFNIEHCGGNNTLFLISPGGWCFYFCCLDM